VNDTGFYVALIISNVHYAGDKMLLAQIWLWLAIVLLVIDLFRIKRNANRS